MYVGIYGNKYPHILDVIFLAAALRVSNMKRLFPHLQRFGKSQVIPLSVLPVTAILIFISHILQYSFPEYSFLFLSNAANEIISILPLLMAVGITMEYTKNDTVGIVCSIFSYFVFVKIISSLNSNDIYLFPGVISGVVVGLCTSIVFHLFKDLNLPAFLGFFSGKRSVPIVNGVMIVLIGFCFAFVWPSLGDTISSLTKNIIYDHSAIAFGIYGLVERTLIPFGLHHIWNTPFMLGLGEYTNSQGQVFHGELARFLAGDKTAGHMAGGYMFKMFGLPGAAAAIWRASQPAQRKKVGIAMGVAALTAFVSGITEPIEFSFMFAAPILYAVHAVLAGSGYVVMELLDVKYSTSFSQGLFDFIALYPLSNKAFFIPLFGSIYFLLYYIVFSVLITALNLKTPGRFDVEIRNKTNLTENIASEIIVAFGGESNIVHLNACITRLRITVQEPDKVDKEKLKSLGATAVVIAGTGVQAIFGTQSDKLRQKMQDLISAK